MKIRQIVLTVSVIIWGASTSAFAQSHLYKWVDEKGNIHYSNTPTQKDAEDVDKALPPASSFISPTPPPSAETATDSAKQPAETAKAKEGEQQPSSSTPDATKPQPPPATGQAQPANQAASSPTTQEDSSSIIPEDGPLSSTFSEGTKQSRQ
jgi:hypothetical protein